MKRWIVFVLAIGLAFPATMGEAGAKRRPDDQRPLHWQVDPDGEGGIELGDRVSRSSTSIWRDEGGFTFRVATTGLKKGHAYTVWVFTYDDPNGCVGGDGQPGTRCAGADLANPTALPSMMWGTGRFAKSSGMTVFWGRREKPSTPCVTEPAVADPRCAGVLMGHGPHNPSGAEIHFVLRDHGPDQEEVTDETTTINGGCDPATHEGLPVFGPGWGTPGDYPCRDPQGN